MSLNLKLLEPLFVFDLANNHMGSLEHGLKIIRLTNEVVKQFPYKFAFKMQYRHLDTFIHPDFKNRTDFKYVKRFSETHLQEHELLAIKNEMKELGFVTVCTPFDECSVDLLEEHDYDIIKVASCSFTDWPLWDRIALTDKPIIASTAGASVADIDKVVAFLEHRQKAFALMHCVAEYPTPPEHLQLGQIQYLKKRFPQVIIGYSTHESPDNVNDIKVAIGNGAAIFEKHVGIAGEGISLNTYSAVPQQVELWLESAGQAFAANGVKGKRPDFNQKEIDELKALRRGAYARHHIRKGDRIKLSDVFFAIPTIEEQFTANEFSKYTEFTAVVNIEAKAPLLPSNSAKREVRQQVYNIIKQVRELILKSGVVVPPKVDIEISHHYGIDRFPDFGLTIFTIVNREYCKKLLILLPGQQHPEQFHNIKEETFHLLYGDLWVKLNDSTRQCKLGEVVTVDRGVRHSFGSRTGAVIEEISSTHHGDDSCYSDNIIMQNDHRKTLFDLLARVS